MTFPEAINSGFQNYVNFQDRSSRSAYWWWVLFAVIVGIVAQVVDKIIGIGIFQILTSLALLLPGIAIGIRRLHDVDKSGWNILWCLTIIGIIYVLYLYVQPGTVGPNKYGPDSLAGSSSELNTF